MKKIPNSFVNDTVSTGSLATPTIPAFLLESYSQCYEDIIIDSIIRAYVKINGMPRGITYVEIGANHPVCTSSTYLFQSRYSMTGILVEANPKLIPSLTKFRFGDRVINAAVVDSAEPTVDFYISVNNETSSLDDRFVSTRTPGITEKITVPTIRINDVLALVKDVELVMLTVDVEGYDLRILKDMDFATYRPFIIQVEPSEDYAPGSTSQIIEFLLDNEYALVGETDVNLIFKDTTK